MPNQDGHYKNHFLSIMAKRRNLQIKVIIYQNQLLKNTFNMLYVWKHSKASKSIIYINILKTEKSSKFNLRTFSYLTLKSIMAIQFGQFKTSIIQTNIIKNWFGISIW